jgi:hypothetical protein
MLMLPSSLITQSTEPSGHTQVTFRAPKHCDLAQAEMWNGSPAHRCSGSLSLQVILGGSVTTTVRSQEAAAVMLNAEAVATKGQRTRKFNDNRTNEADGCAVVGVDVGQRRGVVVVEFEAQAVARSSKIDVSGRAEVGRLLKTNQRPLELK